jgi:hypothetical protein
MVAAIRPSVAFIRRVSATCCGIKSMRSRVAWLLLAQESNSLARHHKTPS